MSDTWRLIGFLMVVTATPTFAVLTLKFARWFGTRMGSRPPRKPCAPGWHVWNEDTGTCFVCDALRSLERRPTDTFYRG